MNGRLATRLRDERGVALVFAVIFTATLLALATSTLYYVARNQSHASYSEASQTAFGLAEAGLARAKGELYTAPDPTANTAVGTTNINNGPEGKIKYWGTLDTTSMIWTVFGQGTVTNPSAPTAITRTVSSKVKVVSAPDPGIWGYLYSDTTTGCMPVANNAVIAAPLYVRGDLCLSNNSHVTGSPLQVEGKLQIGNGASVGYSNAYIALAKLKRGCTFGGGALRPCSTADRVYAQTITQTPDGYTKPPIDLAYWYQNASPGPMRPCTAGAVPGNFDVDTTQDGDRPSFLLTPNQPYSCTAPGGQLTWIPGAPGVLTISGTIFFDGPLVVNGSAIYQGKGTIYAAGTVTFNNSARLCPTVACDAGWDPLNHNIVLVAGSNNRSPAIAMRISNNSVYQGGAYVVGDYMIENNAVNWGPVIANQIVIENNADQIIRFTSGSLPPGIPAYYTTTLEEVPGSFSG